MSKVPRVSRSAADWRYVCTRCGSVNVRRKSAPDGAHGNDRYLWKCRACGRSANAVYDKKRGVEVESVVE